MLDAVLTIDLIKHNRKSQQMITLDLRQTGLCACAMFLQTLVS